MMNGGMMKPKNEEWRNEEAAECRRTNEPNEDAAEGAEWNEE